jgi:hypothetical protein
MTLRLDQFQPFIDGYAKHPEAGIKACEKKLKKDPQNTLYLVSLDPPHRPHPDCPLKIAQAQFQWKLRQYSEALASCHQVLANAPKGRLDSLLLSEIQFTIAECQHGLHTFNHVAGPQLAAFWKQLLDVTTAQQAPTVRKEMLRAAWRDEYWDLAQQVSYRLPQLAVKRAL